MEVCSVVDLIVGVVVIASDLVCFVGNVLTCVVYLVGCVVLVGWVSSCIKGYSRWFDSSSWWCNTSSRYYSSPEKRYPQAF